MDIVYIGKCRHKIQEQKKYRYRHIPAHFEHVLHLISTFKPCLPKLHFCILLSLNVHVVS
jgi:hypothetical protein